MSYFTAIFNSTLININHYLFDSNSIPSSIHELNNPNPTFNSTPPSTQPHLQFNSAPPSIKLSPSPIQLSPSPIQPQPQIQLRPTLYSTPAHIQPHPQFNPTPNSPALTPNSTLSTHLANGDLRVLDDSLGQVGLHVLQLVHEKLFLVVKPQLDGLPKGVEGQEVLFHLADLVEISYAPVETLFAQVDAPRDHGKLLDSEVDIVCGVCYFIINLNLEIISEFLNGDLQIMDLNFEVIHFFLYLLAEVVFFLLYEDLAFFHQIVCVQPSSDDLPILIKVLFCLINQHFVDYFLQREKVLSLSPEFCIFCWYLVEVLVQFV